MPIHALTTHGPQNLAASAHAVQSLTVQASAPDVVEVRINNFREEAGVTTGAGMVWNDLVTLPKSILDAVDPIGAAEKALIEADGIYSGGTQFTVGGEQTLDAAKAQALSLVNGNYNREVAKMQTGYPAAERESWPFQVAEARNLVAGTAGYETPWIEGAAQERGISELELADRILALNDPYRKQHGMLSGRRQRLEAQIAAATTAAEATAVVWPGTGSTLPYAPSPSAPAPATPPAAAPSTT